MAGEQYLGWALRSERVHEIFERYGVTIYDVCETLSGPLAWAVRFCVGGLLMRRFKQ